MPISGLPKILELNINNFLETANVSSWNIRGENENLQVTIRFSMKDTTSGHQMDTSNVTYRKVPPSQTRRDRNRAMQMSSHKQADITLILTVV